MRNDRLIVALYVIAAGCAMAGAVTAAVTIALIIVRAFLVGPQ